MFNIKPYRTSSIPVSAPVLSLLCHLTQSKSKTQCCQMKRRNKRVFYYCQRSALFLYNGGIFSGYPSLLASHLSRPPVRRPVLDPLAANTLTTLCIYIIGFPYETVPMFIFTLFLDHTLSLDSHVIPLKQQLLSCAILGFLLSEALGLFGLMMVFLLFFGSKR